MVIRETITLAAGRRLGYAEYGDPAGMPVMFFHGVPAAGLIPPASQQTAAELGVRLIAVDRPGFGRSDFQRGRRLLHWPLDVEALADALGLTRFAIIGTSCGGPHALACAYALGERLTAVALVSSMGQHGKGSGRGMAWDYRLGWTALRRTPWWLMRPASALLYQALRRRPGGKKGQLSITLGKADRATLANAGVREWLAQNRAEAFRHGTDGTAWELKMLAALGFSLERNQGASLSLAWHSRPRDTIADGQASGAGYSWLPGDLLQWRRPSYDCAALGRGAKRA